MEGIEKAKTSRRTPRHLYVLYAAAALLFFGLLSAAVLLTTYCEHLRDETNRLLAMKIGYVKMRDATAEIHRSLGVVRGVVPGGLFDEQPEGLLAASLDGIKTRFPREEVAVTEMVYREGDVALPVTIKGSLSDYSDFVNRVQYLQAMKFPFFSILSLSIRKSEEIGLPPVVFEVGGELRLPRVIGVPPAGEKKQGSS